jgi:RNA polymerase primary sigma factor
MRQLRITASITNRDHIIEKYLKEIDKLPLISPEEEVDLASLIKTGDKLALNKLVKANLRFAVSVAKKYQGHGLTLSDLINEGNYGLIEAGSKYDPSRGFKFISFAIWHIRRRILMAIAEHARLIKLPMHKIVLRNKINQATRMMEQQLQRQPSAEELAEVLNEELEDIYKTLAHNENAVSLDNPFSEEDESGTLLDTLINTNSDSPEKGLSHKESLNMEISRLLCELNEKQKMVVCSFFGIGIDYPMTLEDIARKMFVTTERVRQIKDKAIEKLRTAQSKNILRGFLAA